MMRCLCLLPAILAISVTADFGRPAADPEEGCAHVSSVFPSMLRELRNTFDKVKDYFQMKDNNLDTILLRDDLLEDFKGQLGCHSVSEMLRFYLDEVLPKANSQNKSIEQTVNFIGNTLFELRHMLKRCHRFLACEKRTKTIRQIKETYSKMEDNGINKAMGEFDIFIDYIEEYLMSKKR